MSLVSTECGFMSQHARMYEDRDEPGACMFQIWTSVLAVPWGLQAAVTSPPLPVVTHLATLPVCVSMASPRTARANVQVRHCMWFFMIICFNSFSIPENCMYYILYIFL